MPGVPLLELRLPQAPHLMDKVKEGHIQEVELIPVHHHRPTHLDPVPHLRPPGPIQEQHLGSSHLYQMHHMPLGPTQGPLLDSNQIRHILQDPIQEPLLDSSLHQMPHTLQLPTQELLLGQTQRHRMLPIQEPHLAPIQEPHLALIQEHLLAHSNQEPHLVPIQEPPLAHSNQEPHLVPIQEPPLAHSNLEPHVALIQEHLLAHSNQEPPLPLRSQELLQAHSNQEPLGNIPILQGQWDLVGCQVHILTHLANHMQILLDHIQLHLALMVSLVLQVLHLVGQGGVGDPRVGSTPHSLIYHILPLLLSQSLVLVPHPLYPGVRFHLVSGGPQDHFLELLDHTQTEAIPEVAGAPSPTLLYPMKNSPLKNHLLNFIAEHNGTITWESAILIFRHVTTLTYAKTRSWIFPLYEH